MRLKTLRGSLFGNLQMQLLYIGVTTTDPRNWDMRSWPEVMKQTWCLRTSFGDTWKDGREAGVCPKWRKTFGYEHSMSVGDTATIYLHGDQSVSIALNTKVIQSVFVEMPLVPLWAVIVVFVKKIEIIQSVASNSFKPAKKRQAPNEAAPALDNNHTHSE